VGEVPTLAEARALFAAHWRAAVAAEAGGRREAASAGDTADRDAPAADGPFGPLYRRHGLRVVERAWSDLLRARGLPLPADVDVAPPPGAAPEVAGGPEAGPDVTTPDTAAPPGPRPAPVPLGARLDEHILVRVGARTIEVTLDRVEGPRPDGAATRPAAPRPSAVADVQAGPPAGDARPVPAPDPVRFVRHRFGRGTGAADLRALLYALAAEQGRGAPAQLFQHNLTTGELEPVRLEPRRLARLRQDLVEALAGMESGVYPPRPDPIMCAACPFLLVCPA
jgi:hypothetical protein